MNQNFLKKIVVYKNNYYSVEEEVKFKNLISDHWVHAFLYRDVNTNKLYAREQDDFIEKFQETRRQFVPTTLQVVAEPAHPMLGREASHKSKGGHYQVLSLVQYKQPDTGEWISGYLYQSVIDQAFYIREISNFEQTFNVN